MELVEQALVVGDLATLSPAQRAKYYGRVCESLGLNPFTRPFEYLQINGKLVLYARRDATDQLRKIHNISVEIVSREQVGDLYVVRARATTPDSRIDESIGAVNTAGLKGEMLANCYMKAETKAKRRVTLSIVGLGWTDEAEIEGVPQARIVTVEEADRMGALPEPASPPEPAAPKSAPAPSPSVPEPLRRSVEAMQRACAKVGLDAPPPPADASVAQVQGWLADRRRELQTRGGARSGSAA